ncbi:MAG: hypothetical protein ACK5MV_14435 [Aminipila sp.]
MEMKEYNNIEKIETLDDGSMSVLMKNGKKAVIEIIRLNEKFQAAIYRLFTPDFDTETQKESTFAKLEKHDAFKECAKEAIGWIDDNPLEFEEPEEVKIHK